jgi:hypothetical protein
MYKQNLNKTVIRGQKSAKCGTKFTGKWLKKGDGNPRITYVPKLVNILGSAVIKGGHIW